MPDRGALAGRVVGDRYGLTGLIGRGGTSAVYEAEHLAIGRVVAIKVLDPMYARNREAVARFHHEARAAGSLGHPNICAIHDLGHLPDGSPYLVMERLHGETLARRFERGLVPPAELVDLVMQVLSALVAAHQGGIVHRDLKPENVFLAERAGMSPSPKLLDFGISKAEGLEDTAAELDDGEVSGTPFYLAPEQARGDRATDHRVDVWAVGVLLYEGLGGARPFTAPNFNALLLQILHGRARPLRELQPRLPAGLVHVVERALCKEPAERFASAAELQRALSPFGPQRARSLAGSTRAHEDDAEDATGVFSRAAMGLPAAAEPSPVAGGDLDDDLTMVDPPAFLSDPEATAIFVDPHRGRR